MKHMTLNSILTEDAVIARCNRKLDQDSWLRVRKARWIEDGPYLKPNSDLGRFYVADVNCNFLVYTHVDLEAYARELGVLRPHESIEYTT
jgi:hypothetical protein